MSLLSPLNHNFEGSTTANNYQHFNHRVAFLTMTQYIKGLIMQVESACYAPQKGQLRPVASSDVLIELKMSGQVTVFVEPRG